MRKLPYFVALFSFLSLIIEYGFSWDISELVPIHFWELFLALFLTINLFWRSRGRKKKVFFFKENFFETILVILFLFSLALFALLKNNPVFLQFISRFTHFTPLTFFFLPVQVFLSLEIIIYLSNIPRILVHLPLKPGQLVVLTYLILVLLGTFLLSLPQANNGEKVSLLDRIFTATSATCVTGLTVVDISKTFRPFGQVIILLLIQVGGLGLVSFVTFFALIMGRGIGFKERAFLKDVFDYETVGELEKLVITILLFTFLIEGAGTLIMAKLFSQFPERIPSPFFYGLFHAVSAFCNAGFSLFSESLRSFISDTPINFSFAFLIILGGLGFLVVQDIIRFISRRLRRKQAILSLHTRLVLITTLLLLVGGFVVIFILFPSGYSLKERFLASFFQSVTARTAGFSTVEISSFPSSLQVLLIFLMFVGASPGSTGGGIKTSTFAVVILTVISYLKGKERVEVFTRTIPSILIHRIIAIVSFSLAVVAVSVFLLTLTEDFPFLSLLFEAVSAFGTVGLSHGITPQLTPAGKVILIFTMLVGRIGPLTLALAIGPRFKKVSYRYPEERVIVG